MKDMPFSRELALQIGVEEQYVLQQIDRWAEDGSEMTVINKFYSMPPVRVWDYLFIYF